MLFTQSPTLPLTVCGRCKGTAYLGLKKCSQCRGMCVGRMVREKFHYFGEPLTRYHIALRRARRFLYRFEIIGGVVFALSFLGLGVYSLGSKLSFSDFFALPFFWFSVVAWSFLLYIVLKNKKEPPFVEKSSFDSRTPSSESLPDESAASWEVFCHLPKKKKIDIADTYTEEARQVLEDCYRLADKHGSREVSVVHLFYGLLSNEKIRGVFLRLGLPVQLFQAKLAELFEKNTAPAEPTLSTGVQQILFQAYEEAFKAGQDFVNVTEILVAAVQSSTVLQEMLYDLDIENDKLTNVVQWVRIRERIRRQYGKFRRAASHRNKYGLDRAMTAVATPFLNSFSQDLTMAAVYGNLTPCVAREKEIEELFRVIEAGRQSVVLVGDHGVGKMTIIQGIVQKMVEDAVPKRLQDKRLVQLSTSSLLAGTTVSGAQERLIRMVHEISRARNIILFIDNIHDLIGAGDDTGLDVSKTLAEFMGQGNVLLFATSTPNGYNQHILNSEVGSLLSKVEIKEMNENQTIQVLEAKAGFIEYKQNIFFSYASLASAAKLAARFLHDQILPESAVELITEAASYTHNKKGENQLVTADDVAVIINEKTGVPVTAITDDESTKLLKLEDEMHKRVIGQHEAVQLVANALRRARVEIRSTNRPIANFLFLGPTGVGKTELAKTIAEVYFGGEASMVRLDMSEFQDSSSIYRLIGQPGQQGTGLLAEAVRQRPFSLVLLDEMEKADPKILDLFLQVFDDGRLTDSVGRVIDFTNTIIIATSNAGTPYIQEGIRLGTPVSEIQSGLLRTELKNHFRPEFLNRFDGLVVFKPLDREAVSEIARLMLKRVAKDLENRGIELQVTASGIDELSEIGFDPEFGARPMRRAIQDHVENKLADLVLQGKLQRRDVVVFDGRSGMRVERK